MAASKQKEGATTLREKKGGSSSSSSSTVSSARRSPSSRSSLPTSPLRRPERPTVAPSRGPTVVTASTAVAKPPSTRRPTERNAPAATAVKERAVVHKAPSSSSKAAASHKPSASAPASKGRASHSTSSAAVRGRSPGAVAKRKEASKTVSLSRTSSDPGSLDQLAASILLGNSKIEESTETAASISSIEDHLPDERLPDPVDSKAVEDPPPPPHECDEQQQQHEQSLLQESEGVAQLEEMIKEDNIEIAHNNTTLEDPKGGGGDEVVGENYNKKEKLVVLLEVKKSTEGVMKSNDVIEETRSKLLERKKSKVRALVGAFETVMSLHGSSDAQTEDQTQEEKGGGEIKELN